MLIKRLPPDTELMRELAPRRAELAAWGPSDYILADLYDATTAAHFKNPKPYPRPADVIRERERREEHNRLLEEQAERIKAREREAEGVD